MGNDKVNGREKGWVSHKGREKCASWEIQMGTDKGKEREKHWESHGERGIETFWGKEEVA